MSQAVRDHNTFGSLVMLRRSLAFGLLIVLVAFHAAAADSSSEAHVLFDKTVKPFLAKHCIKCHGADDPDGDIRLDSIKIEGPKAAVQWAMIRNQIRDGLMPPAKEPRPDAAQARAVVAWATKLTGAKPFPLPNQGNLIPHELLFGEASSSDGSTPARIWRVSPDVYSTLTSKLAKDAPGVSQPFTLVDERGIRDFSGLYSADVPSTEILVRNAIAIVDAQTTAEYTVIPNPPKGSLEPQKPEQRKNGNAVAEFLKLVDPAAAPTPKQLESAVRTQFRMAIGRAPSADEVAPYLALNEKCLKSTSDSPSSVRTMLQAVLLRTDAIFRYETGSGSGRTMLPPFDLARTLSLTLGNRLDGALVTAAEKGQLTNRQQVEDHVRRMLTDERVDTSRIPKFFREYFEYHNAADVFKENPKGALFYPNAHIRDTDLLVRHILEQDKDVFRQLLTTPLTFVNATAVEKKDHKTKGEFKKTESNPGGVDKKTGKFTLGIEGIYGFEEWSIKQPLEAPSETRIGILMQPSWLMAWSTNFDNDPVRRGRWIRERLLGGTVPDLPIGVVAQVPDDPHQTYRDRLTVTRKAECWKCHRWMDELGLPFEQFNHYGHFRKTETVLDVESTEKNVDSKGKSKGKVYHEVPLNTLGVVADSGDPALDGSYKDPREMIRKIANSDRARQVFVRHVFRYFLGRNESLSDAKTLQEADAAYVKSGGSFRALVVSLLTSDPFLYRTNSQQLTSLGERQ